MADHIIFSTTGANTNNYVNVHEIVEQATRNNVDAVCTVCSFASENPQLPEELNKRNIVFIGPPSKALFALSDKIASTIIAQTVKIPTIAWSGSGLIIESTGEGKEKGGGGNESEISKELYLKACISTAEEGLLSMKEKNITYPVMIKSSKGCNGKGTRKCISDEEFCLNFTSVKEEVPEAPIFLMKFMVDARNIEVQLIGDHYGKVIPIFTRVCSIEGSFQKTIKGTPECMVPPEIKCQMQMDAVTLAKKIGYVSAGTVEVFYFFSFL
ncbi:unnamed protein product [Meloidogyne enterolobii]|uniref:Uncharacterized protein n=1 Tax=Meloidogyne enterolobii TaxID=390850 RepID=A0ACB1AZM4_MELEN